MSATVRYLSALLVFQILLSAYIHFGKENIGEFKTEDPLISQSLKDISSITLTESGNNTLTVKKDGTSWIIPSAENHPASSQKIENIVSELQSLTKPYPAGNTLLAAKNFQTAKEDFKHKLVLSSGEQEKAQIYFGKSPGFKKVYARVGDSEKTYAIAFPNHNLQIDQKFWLDKDYTSLDRSLIKTLTVKGVSLNITDSTIEMVDLPEGKTLDTEKATQLLVNATQIRFSELLGTKEQNSFNLMKPYLTYRVVKNDDSEVTYTIGKMVEGEKKEESFVLKRSDMPYYYKILKFQVEKVHNMTRDQLLKDSAKKTEGKDSDKVESKETTEVDTQSTE